MLGSLNEDVRGRLHGDTVSDIGTERQAFDRHSDGAGDRPLSFISVTRSQSLSTTTSHAAKPLHEELRRRIETRTVSPAVEITPMRLGMSLAFGQISEREVEVWRWLSRPLWPMPIDWRPEARGSRTWHRPARRLHPAISATFAAASRGPEGGGSSNDANAIPRC